MTYAAFDVVLVPFPFADRLTEKLRPAVVISDPRLEAATGVIWVTMVTSARSRDLQGDVPVTDLQLSGLHTPCLVRTAKTATLDPSRVVQRIGVLAGADARAVGHNVRAWLATAPD